METDKILFRFALAHSTKMKNIYLLSYRAYQCLFGKFVRRNLIKGIGKKNMQNLHVLLYYKTAPFWNKSLTLTYQHPNNWEIIEIVRIFNTLGFVVDVIDRSIDYFLPENKYVLFLGIGSGDSGKNFPKYAECLSDAVKIFYATGAEPEISKQNVYKRYIDLKLRRGVYLPPMRVREKVDIYRAMELTDYIFCIGNEFSISSYKNLFIE